MMEYIRKNLGIRPLCNRRAERAPHIGKFCFPLCWRCTAALLGIIAINYSHWIIFESNYAAVYIMGVLMITPCFIDGLLQHTTAYVSNNYKRAATGFIAGIGIQLIIKVTVAMAIGL